MKYYYLLGEDVCWMYHDEGVEYIKANDNVEFSLSVFDPECDHPSQLLFETQGWFDFAEITEEEYKTLCKHPNFIS